MTSSIISEGKMDVTKSEKMQGPDIAGSIGPGVRHWHFSWGWEPWNILNKETLGVIEFGQPSSCAVQDNQTGER